MIRLSSLITAALCGFAPLAYAPVACAQDMPARKPGLWETSMDTGRSDAQLMSLCVDAVVEAKAREMGAGTMGNVCSQHSTRRDGATITSDSVCQVGSRQVTSHSVTTITGDSAYTTVMKSHFDPPMQGAGADQTMTQSAKWLGPCPADMKPGDMMINGMKMQMPGFGPGAR